MPENNSVARESIHWYVISWVELIPSIIYLINLPCSVSISFSDTRNDTIEWMTVIGIGLISLNAIYLSIRVITFRRINFVPWATRAITIFTVLVSIILVLAAICGWFLSTFYPHIVLYFGEDPQGMPAFAFGALIYLGLLIALSIHTYRSRPHQGPASNTA